jgi:hypothetical protein
MLLIKDVKLLTCAGIARIANWWARIAHLFVVVVWNVVAFCVADRSCASSAFLHIIVLWFIAADGFAVVVWNITAALNFIILWNLSAASFCIVLRLFYTTVGVIVARLIVAEALAAVFIDWSNWMICWWLLIIVSLMSLISVDLLTHQGTTKH